MNDFISMIKYHQSEKIPIWFMRQAGRYMKLYQDIRRDNTIREICMNPELTEKITYEPIKLLSVDSAIIFADIILPLEAMGYKIDFNSNGPVIENGYVDNREMNGIYEFDNKNLKYRTVDAIKLFKEKHKIPLIGFSGGIITILSYIFSGKSDNNLSITKKVMFNDEIFKNYVKLVKEMIIEYLKIQVKSGVDAIQIFDSWLGSLSPYTFNKYLKKDITEIINEFKGKIPIIYFSTGTSGIIDELRDTGPDFISIDWRIKLSHVRKIIGNNVGLQGNLDPYLVSYNQNEALQETRNILKDLKNHEGYIFNLGHGVLPETNENTLKNIVELIHNYK